MTEEVLRIGNPPAAIKKPRSRKWIIVVAAALVVAIGAAMIYFVLQPGTFTVTGTVRVGSDSIVKSTGQSCYGTGGYKDLAPGGQVIVTDAGGATIAVGALELGSLSTSTGCTMPFTVNGVPDGHAFYGVEVTHRGRLQYSEDDIKRPLVFSLGN